MLTRTSTGAESLPLKIATRSPASSAALRAQDPTEAMRALLGELRLENYPCLQGRTFSLLVGGEQGAHAVRLVT